MPTDTTTALYLLDYDDVPVPVAAYPFKIITFPSQTGTSYHVTKRTPVHILWTIHMAAATYNILSVGK